MPTTDRPRYLKAPGPPAPEVSDEIRRRVAAMLQDISTGGVDAVRRWSRELDGWDGPDDTGSFVVTEEDFERAAARLDEGLKAHIAFAQEQVRTFALAQRATLTDLERRVAAGRRAGPRAHPGGRRSAPTCPAGRYPLLASSFMTVVVAKVAGVRARRRRARRRRATAASTRRCCTRSATSGADAVVCLGGVQALAAMAFGLLGDCRRST